MSGHVVLGVSGGIAAFRAVEVLRSLIRAGCRVTPILTRNATEFVTARTFSVLAGEPAQVSLWEDHASASIDHIDLARSADLLLIAPATANVIAKLAGGIADDALTTYALAHRRAVLVAPAMNTFMWRHAATQAALAALRGRGIEVIEPDAGVLACGEVGEGRLPEVGRIVRAALDRLPHEGPLAGLTVLVTVGPTREPIDAVRVITNRSSGRMGLALAAEARKLGAAVLVLAAAGIDVPGEIAAERFETAEQLQRAMNRLAPTVDVVLHAAAVADFRCAAPASGKLDRRGGGTTLDLVPVPDLAATLQRRADGGPELVIFAAETSARLEERATMKLAAKGAVAVIANPIDEPGAGMEVASNRALVITRDGFRRDFPLQDKTDLARDLLLFLAPSLISGSQV